MTREQILAADPITLTVEAHRIMGLTIEKHEAGGVYPSGNEEEYTNWRATYRDGSGPKTYCDCETPTVRLLDKLNVDNFAESWDAAAELLEHWPSGNSDGQIGYRGPGMVKMIGVTFVLGDKLLVAIEDHYRAEPFPLAITRAFVLAYHGSNYPSVTLRTTGV